MTKIWKPKSTAKRAHPKLDLRLSAIIELDGSVFASAPTKDAVRDGALVKSKKEASNDLLRSGPLALMRGTPVTFRGASVMAGGAKVPVFVTVKDRDALQRLPVKPRSSAGCIATMEADLPAIEALEASEDVLAVEWSGGVRPQEAKFATTKAIPPRQAVGLDSMSGPVPTGANTCIGIIDGDGIDIYHPDFIDSNRMTAILSLWDQSARTPGRGSAGRSPEPWGYGIEYTRDEVFEEINPNQQRRYSVVDHEPLKGSHGTKVASIAAGRGVADAAATGVAPGAAIVFVNTVNSGPSALAAMTELAEAVDYVFQRAGALPCVVNVSLGDNLGSHDGKSPVERFIDALLDTPGRAVTIAAGNSNDTRKQARGSLDAGKRAAAFTFEIGEREQTSVVIEIWHDAEAGLAVEIVGPNDTGQCEPVEPLGLPRAFDVDGTRVLVGSIRGGLHREMGHVRVELFPGVEGGSLRKGRWTIRLFARDDGGCAWHAWIDHPCVACVPDDGAPPVITLTSPATCHGAITVGAFHPETGTALPCSGCGPARCGTPKPEVCACGSGILAASAATPNRYDPCFSGTSAAAPQVAGLVALMFERHGASLTAEEAKRQLIEATDGTDLGVPDPALGFGRARLPRLSEAHAGLEAPATEREAPAEQQARRD